MFLYIYAPFLPNFSMGFLNPHVQCCMRVFTILAPAVSTIFYTLGALVNRKLEYAFIAAASDWSITTDMALAANY